MQVATEPKQYTYNLQIVCIVVIWYTIIQYNVIKRSIPSLILLTLNSLANFSNSLISGESISMGSSIALLFLLNSCLKSVVTSSRRVWCTGAKPWPSVQELALIKQGGKLPVWTPVEEEERLIFYDLIFNVLLCVSIYIKKYYLQYVVWGTAPVHCSALTALNSMYTSCGHEDLEIDKEIIWGCVWTL